MPSTIEELNAAIQDITSQANSILFLNHNILEEYERRQRKVNFFSLMVYLKYLHDYVFYPLLFIPDR